jgi:hypothetical protein
MENNHNKGVVYRKRGDVHRKWGGRLQEKESTVTGKEGDIYGILNCKRVSLYGTKIIRIKKTRWDYSLCK